jgi:hypothetical protein
MPLVIGRESNESLLGAIMYTGKSTEIKIRNRVTGEVKTAYQGHKPWIIVDEKGNEIMSDW